MATSSKIHELTFNVGLAQVLRETRSSLSIQGVDIVRDERLKVFHDSSERPSVLIDDPLSPPIVIKASFDEHDAEIDAKNRLGQKLRNGGIDACGSIALVIPSLVREKQNSRNVTEWLLAGSKFK